MNDSLYRERVTYHRGWSTLFGLLPVVGLIVAFVNPGDVALGLIVAAALALPAALVYFGALTLSFTKTAFRYRYTGGLQSGTVLREDIAEAEVIPYDPWGGLATGNLLRDRRIIVGGDYVLRVKLRSGRSIILTTHRPAELRDFLRWWLTGRERPPGERLDLRDIPEARAAGGGRPYSAEDLV